jgi:hypothetical protein
VIPFGRPCPSNDVPAATANCLSVPSPKSTCTLAVCSLTAVATSPRKLTASPARLVPFMEIAPSSNLIGVGFAMYPRSVPAWTCCETPTSMEPCGGIVLSPKLLSVAGQSSV